MTSSPFGRVLSAIVTPMRADASIDLEAAAALAKHLVDQGHDGVVVNGTTGESPTTTDDEKLAMIRAVKEAVGERAKVVAGAGTYDTHHSVTLARASADAGADALLVVTPYYNKPPQEGLKAHFTTVADATDLPVMLYDIPGRSGVPIEFETLLALAEHPRIRAVKDAKADFWQANQVMAQTDLLWFSGNDTDNLTQFALGATGFVGVTSQVAPKAFAAMAAAALKDDLPAMRRIHRDVIPLVNACMNITQGAIMVKAALAHQGLIPTPTVRLPLVPATQAQTAAMVAALQGTAS